MKIRTLIFLQVLLCFISSSAYAQTTFNIVADRRVTIPTLTNNDNLLLRANSGSSYCCDLAAEVGSAASPYFNSTSVSVTDFAGTTTVTGRFSAESPELANGQGRVCFILNRSFDQPQATLNVGVAGGPATNAQAECRETTLFGGFNTSVTDFNFLEISNTLDSTSALAAAREVTCSVTAINTVPNPDTVAINQQTVTIAAGSRSDVDIHSAAGTGAFGPVVLACNGAPGAIKAVMSQYNVTSTSPTLDFAPVAQDVLQTRASLAGPGGS